ncbi:hypothetical protein HDU96_005845 [Phlyctochytrium bullatum]|nr:hypothetical protein HDU96_005845 [Phlyctochytrium bullatum]
MSKVIVVAGYCRAALQDAGEARQGRQGLSATGATVKGFAVGLGDSAAVKKTITDIRSTLGCIDILFWNPYPAGNVLLTATPENLHASFNLQVVSLVAAVQTALDDLKANKGAVLVTG